MRVSADCLVIDHRFCTRTPFIPANAIGVSHADLSVLSGVRPFASAMLLNGSAATPFTLPPLPDRQSFYGQLIGERTPYDV